MKKFVNIFIFMAEKVIDILIFFIKIIMGIFRIIKMKHLGFAVGTSLIGVIIFAVINVTLRPFSDEITNTEQFIDYYQDTEEENGDILFLAVTILLLRKFMILSQERY